MVRVGVIARPHALAGALAVTLDSPGSRTLLDVEHVHLARTEDDPAPARHEVVAAMAGRKGQVILTFAGVRSPEAAELFRGLIVLLSPDQLPPLEAGEFFHDDLLKLTAYDRAGVALGPVIEVVDTAEIAVLVVRAEGGERFVPLTASHVLEVDLAGKRIVVAPPEE